ncbi:MAG: response regulator transcription factor [Bacteroidetes bacterium]|nr:response regulator transcription factor [Bacteroidota bacterium]
MENIKVHRILIAEDEPKIGLFVQQELISQGYETDLANSGAKAIELYNQHKYSIIILDINLGDMSGIQICRSFRENDIHVPVIMLTAMGDMNDKILAFESGADDYVVKPFHISELLARIKVFLKRSEGNTGIEEILKVKDLEINISNKMVSRNGANINLTMREFALLLLLCKNKGHAISKKEILLKVWGLDFETGTNTVEVYINFLRNKVDRHFSSKLIRTKTGFGYYISEE